jgi:hypothetical protein
LWGKLRKPTFRLITSHPPSASTTDEGRQQWPNKYRFPSDIGVVDCTPVRNPKPALRGDEYVNRNCFASADMQATYDAKDMLTSAHVGWPGSVHNSRIRNNSDVRVTMTMVNYAVLL